MSKITKEQIKVLKEVARDAELFGEFLCKIAYVCYKDTNADKLKVEVDMPMPTEKSVVKVKFNYEVSSLSSNRLKPVVSSEHSL